MKNFTTLFLSFVLSALSFGLSAQILCSDGLVSVALNPWNCSHTLNAQNIPCDFDGNLENIIFSKSLFTYEDRNMIHEVGITALIDGQVYLDTILVRVSDATPPVVIVKANIVMGLTIPTGGTEPYGKLFYQSVDNGSHDGECTPQDELEFSPSFWEFGCADIGEQTIFLTVTDNDGNVNSTWTTVKVEFDDIAATTITCPDNAVVDCDIDIMNDDDIDTFIGRPTSDSNCPSFTFTDDAKYDENGDGDYNDTFTLNGEEYPEFYNFACNHGVVVRTWKVNDNIKCDQLIFVKDGGAQFDGSTMIDWPYSQNNFASVIENDGQSDCNGDGVPNDILPGQITYDPTIAPDSVWIESSCLDNFCEDVAWESVTCALLGHSIERDTFLFNQNSCITEVITHTVVNWCEYDPNDPSSEGIWKYVVTGLVSDIDPPAITANDVSLLSCSTTGLSISALAMDQEDDGQGNMIDKNCPSSEFKWVVRLDLESDFTTERIWSSYVDEDHQSNLWDDDDGDGIPEVRVGNIGGVDNASDETPDIGLPYSINLPDDLDLGIGVQHRVVWTVYDNCGNSNSATSYFTLDAAGADTKKPTPYCINLATGLFSDDQNGLPILEIYAIDFNAGAFDNCTAAADLRWTFEEINPDSDPSYNDNVKSSSRIITPADLDANGIIEIQAYVWDEAGNFNFCNVTMKVEDTSDCNLSTSNSIIWPNPYVILDIAGLHYENTETELSPANMVDIYGLAITDAEPTLVNSECEGSYEETYDDLSIPLSSDDEFKLIRQWTVLHWITGSVYEFDQIIKVLPTRNEICDTLPNSAVFGDCDSGHTMDDDVEWPDDLNISDHRITPAELVIFSMVDPLDAEPEFTNNAALYNVSYVDHFVNLTETTLFLNRVWTASRTDILGAYWSYSQKLTVDISDFGNLVSVNTPSNRPLPNVDVNDLTSTDQNGIAFVDSTAEVNPVYDDNIYNGVNILDAHLLRKHILGENVLDASTVEYLADLSGDQSITTVDLILLTKSILGEIDAWPERDAWSFLDMNDLMDFHEKPRASYLALKAGDLDDDAVIDQVIDYPTMNLQIEDFLINAGETYEAEVILDGNIVLIGMELHFDYDPANIEILSVNAVNIDNVSYNTQGNQLHVLHNNEPDGQFVSEYAVVKILFKAKSNTLLHDAFVLSSNRNSYVLERNSEELIKLNLEIDQLINTNTNDITDHNDLFNVYPNPAIDIINFDFNAEQIGDYTITVFDLTGRAILQKHNNSQLNISNINPGQYFYRLQLNEESYTGKFIKIK